MADFRNHRKFSLRYLSKDVLPVSVRVKSNMITPRGYNIIKSVERTLLNERIRMINNTLEMFEYQRDTCINQLTRVLDKEVIARV